MTGHDYRRYRFKKRTFRNQYLGPLELMANTLDWSLEDTGLLGIRSRAHFNRTLGRLERDEQTFWEYLNYTLAILALVLIAALQKRRRIVRNRHYQQTLGGAA